MKTPIYLGILLLIILALLSLPLQLPISSFSRGVIRSAQENTQITTVVSGKITRPKLKKQHFFHAEYGWNWGIAELFVTNHQKLRLIL